MINEAALKNFDETYVKNTEAFVKTIETMHWQTRYLPSTSLSQPVEVPESVRQILAVAHSTENVDDVLPMLDELLDHKLFMEFLLLPLPDSMSVRVEDVRVFSDTLHEVKGNTYDRPISSNLCDVPFLLSNVCNVQIPRPIRRWGLNLLHAIAAVGVTWWLLATETTIKPWLLEKLCEVIKSFDYQRPEYDFNTERKAALGYFLLTENMFML